MGLNARCKGFTFALLVGGIQRNPQMLSMLHPLITVEVNEVVEAVSALH